MKRRGDAFKCVVKPVRSAGTDGVTFCESVDEARSAIEFLMQKESVFGDANESVVCQEFLVGKEYASLSE